MQGHTQHMALSRAGGEAGCGVLADTKPHRMQPPQVLSRSSRCCCELPLLGSSPGSQGPTAGRPQPCRGARRGWERVHPREECGLGGAAAPAQALAAQSPVNQQPPPSMAEKPQIQLFVKVSGGRLEVGDDVGWAGMLLAATPGSTPGWGGSATPAHPPVHLQVPRQVAGSLASSPAHCAAACPAGIGAQQGLLDWGITLPLPPYIHYRYPSCVRVHIWVKSGPLHTSPATAVPQCLHLHLLGPS